MTVQAQAAQPRTTLGISAKSLHTGKLRRKPDTAEKSPIEMREMRYALQRTAQGLLWDRDAHKQHRTCSCCRNVASDGVPVYRTVDGGDARFGNLLTCGSVWACPVCSAKITEQRRAELQDAINAWVTHHEGKVLLMTLTFPHEYDMPLAELLEKFAKALTKFKNSRAYKSNFGTLEKPGLYQRAGSVRSLEVTYGENGWHPHTHDLVFLKDDSIKDNPTAMDTLRKEWVYQLVMAGLGDDSKLNDMLQYSFDLQGGDYAAEYVAKFGHEPKLYQSWSAAREVTKGMSKIGGGAHATPFMLLQWYHSNNDEKAGALFREYAAQFEGKRMLSWSPGLKKLLQLPEQELTDEELAQQEDSMPEEELVCRLTTDQWKLVLTRNARYDILLMAAKHGEQGVAAMLEELETRPASHSGWFLDHARPRFH
jgi:hypothetical protein